LVTRDDGSANLSRRDLGHVQDDDSGDETDTETGYETTGDELESWQGLREYNRLTHETETVRSGLENDTDNEDGTSSDNSEPSTKVVGQVT
jgi:hypothetical protein